MSLTLLAWLGLFGLLVLLCFRRPAYGVSVYMLTFFAFPDFWWWGDPILGYRWSLYGGLTALGAVILSRLINNVADERVTHPKARLLGWIALGILVNATVVHIALSDSMDVSAEAYELLAKFVLLFFLIVAASRTKEDLRVILLSIVFGAGYIGYECTINDRGRLRGTRLEGVGAPGATGANQLASLMVTVIPITGAFFLAGRPWERVAMLPIAPFILNVVILCNSRGAFLALIGSCFALLFFAPPLVRKRIVKLLCLGGVAAWLLLGDPRIVERFVTTFVSMEERDSSAASRLDYWKAGLRMVADHPMGSGGSGFKRVHGPKHIKEVNDQEFNARAVHNGFINEACEWGLQGFLLRMTFVGGALFLLWQTSRSPGTESDPFSRLLGPVMFAAMVGFLGSCLFGDQLDAEWGYWIVALAAAYACLYDRPHPVTEMNTNTYRSPTAYPYSTDFSNHQQPGYRSVY